MVVNSPSLRNSCETTNVKKNVQKETGSFHQIDIMPSGMVDLRKSKELETPDLTQKYFFIFMANTIFCYDR